MTRFKLLVTDLDGTLLASDGEPHPADRAAIDALRESGVHVSVCTGRMYSGTRDVARGLKIRGPIGCLDGSHIVDPEDDRDLAMHPIHDEARELLREALDTHRPISFVFADDAVFHDELGEAYLQYVEQWSARSLRLERLLDAASWSKHKLVSAVVSVGDEKQIRGAADRLAETAAEHLQTVTFNVSSPEYRGAWGLVVRAAGVNKATAVEWIAKHYGVSMAEVITVGDWINDVSMLEAAGRSFAMGQAPPQVKAAATDVLDADAWTGGGIAEAARRCGLL